MPVSFTYTSVGEHSVACVLSVVAGCSDPGSADVLATYRFEIWILSNHGQVTRQSMGLWNQAPLILAVWAEAGGQGRDLALEGVAPLQAVDEEVAGKWIGRRPSSASGP